MPVAASELPPRVHFPACCGAEMDGLLGEAEMTDPYSSADDFDF